MSKKTVKKPKFQWNGYCNVDIPESHSGDVAKYLKDEKVVFADYNSMLFDEYQIKVYFDKERDRVVANAICHNGDSTNYGHALSAFAGDWFTALAVLLYKHVHLTDGEWAEHSSSVSKPYG